MTAIFNYLCALNHVLPRHTNVSIPPRYETIQLINEYIINVSYWNDKTLICCYIMEKSLLFQSQPVFKLIIDFPDDVTRIYNAVWSGFIMEIYN